MTPPRPGPLCLRWVWWFRLWVVGLGGLGLSALVAAGAASKACWCGGVVAAPAAATTVFGGCVGLWGLSCGVCFCCWALLLLLLRLPWVTNLVKFPRDVPQEGVLGSLTWGFAGVVGLLFTSF